MIQLAVNELQKEFNIYPILKGVSFEIGDHERVGIVGKNGSGKTTLFRMIMGLETVDHGDIFIRKGAKLGYVEQIPHYDREMTVEKVLKTAFNEVMQLKDKMALLEEEMAKASSNELKKMLEQYGKISELFESQGGYEIEEQISRMSEGLHFDKAFLKKSFMSLSGGEKTRVLLGKVLLEKPDILLLDEPTNHLDVKALEWLEAYLKNYKGAILFISHDRYFLDQTATKIVELERGRANVFYGNYTQYMKEKEDILLAEFEAYKDQQKKIKAMEKAIKRLRTWGQEGDNEDMFKKAAAMQKRLDKMEKLEKPTLNEASIALNFKENERSGKDVISLKSVAKRFGEKILFDHLDWEVTYQEHVALIGENGCGKSTLIKMILDEEQPDQGEIRLGTRVKIGYLPQNVHFPDEELTVLQVFKGDRLISETKARQILAKFLFYGEKVFKKVKNLSGGEKSRLLLCMLIQQDINLLILDEPTNHLDIASRESLEEALQSFTGTIIFVSHDRYFINKLASRISEVKKQHIINYIGDYEYYKEKRMQFNEQLQQENTIPEKKLPLEKANKQQSHKTSINTYKVNKLEEEITALEARKKEIEKVLEEVGTDYVKCLEIQEEDRKLKEKLETLMQEWIQMNISLES